MRGHLEEWRSWAPVLQNLPQRPQVGKPDYLGKWILICSRP